MIVQKDVSGRGGRKAGMLGLGLGLKADIFGLGLAGLQTEALALSS